MFFVRQSGAKILQTQRFFADVFWVVSRSKQLRLVAGKFRFPCFQVKGCGVVCSDCRNPLVALM